MLGITVPDAIALGTLVLAALAAWQGSVRGAAAKHAIPRDPGTALIGASLVDTATMQDLVSAVERLTDAVLAHLDERKDRERKEERSQMIGLLEQISEKIGQPRDRYRRPR